MTYEMIGKKTSKSKTPSGGNPDRRRNDLSPSSNVKSTKQVTPSKHHENPEAYDPSENSADSSDDEEKHDIPMNERNTMEIMAERMALLTAQMAKMQSVSDDQMKQIELLKSDNRSLTAMTRPRDNDAQSMFSMPANDSRSTPTPERYGWGTGIPIYERETDRLEKAVDTVTEDVDDDVKMDDSESDMAVLKWVEHINSQVMKATSCAKHLNNHPKTFEIILKSFKETCGYATSTRYNQAVTLIRAARAKTGLCDNDPEVFKEACKTAPTTVSLAMVLMKKWVIDPQEIKNELETQMLTAVTLLVNPKSRNRIADFTQAIRTAARGLEAIESDGDDIQDDYVNYHVTPERVKLVMKFFSKSIIDKLKTKRLESKKDDDWTADELIAAIEAHQHNVGPEQLLKVWQPKILDQLRGFRDMIDDALNQVRIQR